MRFFWSALVCCPRTGAYRYDIRDLALWVSEDRKMWDMGLQQSKSDFSLHLVIGAVVCCHVFHCCCQVVLLSAVCIARSSIWLQRKGHIYQQPASWLLGLKLVPRSAPCFITSVMLFFSLLRKNHLYQLSVSILVVQLFNESPSIVTKCFLLIV